MAKLVGGIYLNYKRIKNNEFVCSLSESKEDIYYEYKFDDYMHEHLEIIKDYHYKKNLDFKHTLKLMSLIFLNMAPLHTNPFDLMLLALSYKYHE